MSLKKSAVVKTHVDMQVTYLMIITDFENFSQLEHLLIKGQYKKVCGTTLLILFSPFIIVTTVNEGRMI